MRYLVRHTTSYEYSEPVSICHNEARLVPRQTPHQRPVVSRLVVEPSTPTLTSDTDYFGNVVHFFTLEEAHVRLSVSAISEVDLVPFEPPPLMSSPAWDGVRDRIRRDRSPEGLCALELTLESPHVRRADPLIEYAAPSFPPGRPLLDAVLELTRRIHADFAYEPGSTTIATPIDRVLESRRGVCQDFAHLQIGMLRSLGIPARYVSGYVHNTPPPGRPRLVGADASHAWLSAWCPGFGFVDFDPTNGSIPSDEHVTLAWGRDFSDTSPLRGVILGGGQHLVRVGVEVARA
ncbi:MAG: transglutaminase family protein [Myxococcota bacterium]|jgi:transglutaminase-like putative cysteine protease|nr:transglutaminase family protein [Myxococcota bacterium]